MCVLYVCCELEDSPSCFKDVSFGNHQSAGSTWGEVETHGYVCPCWRGWEAEEELPQAYQDMTVGTNHTSSIPTSSVRNLLSCKWTGQQMGRTGNYQDSPYRGTVVQLVATDYFPLLILFDYFMHSSWAKHGGQLQWATSEKFRLKARFRLHRQLSAFAQPQLINKAEITSDS